MNHLLTNLSEIQIKYEPKVKHTDRPIIRTSKDAYDVIIALFDQEVLQFKEESVAIFLNRGNRVIGAYKLSSGGITETVIDIRLLLSIALKCLAVGIILAHSHPSYNLKPSTSDREITEKIDQGAKLMNINLFDHLIISPEPNMYYSFADDGLI